jgi:hypothetical protein
MAVTVNIDSLIIGTSLTASLATIYGPVPANTRARIDELIICNTDSTARRFTINIIESGDSAAVKNTIFTNAPIGAGETLTPGLNQTLRSGAFVQASADAADVVSIRGSGIEVV